MIMKVFEDPYKSEGSVQLKIEKLSQFAQGEDYSLLESDIIYVRGLPWKLMAVNLENDVDLKQRVVGYCLESRPKNAGPEWSCNCSATLKVLAQKEGKEDYTEKFSHLFNVNKKIWRFSGFHTFEALMNPELGWYDEATDSIIFQVQIAANAPHGVKNMPDDVYTEYALRSEHALFLKLKDGLATNNKYSTSNLVIEDKLWSFTYSLSDKKLQLEMSMHESDCSKTTAECIFWYWNDKEIAILQKSIHVFGESTMEIVDSAMKYSLINVPINGASPGNNKFNVVPKHDLMRASPVFQRMFASEMTEKALNKVVIEDTNPGEFGDFLKAISPKQEHPTPSNVFALLKLADRYQIQLLRDRCENHLMNCVEIPFIHRLTCANFYGLDKLKNNLMVSLDGTGLYKLLQQTEPYIGVLKELTRKRKHT